MSQEDQQKIVLPFGFARFRYTLLPENELYLPLENRGHVLRGAFGSSLKKMVCLNPRAPCPNCITREECAYFQIFSPQNLHDSRRLKDTPRGFVIKPSLEERKFFTPSNPFFFDFVLFGNRIKYNPLIIAPINALGSMGIGSRRDRFTLFNIETIKNGERESIYDIEKKLVRNFFLNSSMRDLWHNVEAINKDKIHLKFLTPTRIRYNPTGEKGKSQIIRVPEFHHLFKRLRDRISALSLAYGEGPLNIDFKGLGERAERIKLSEANIKWIEIRRKSRTQGTWHDQSGFVGDITYTGDLEEFLPFLVLGEYTHVGEDAVFGNGWYKILTSY